MIVNRDERGRGPASSFASVADAYERGRPGYSDEAVRWLVGDDPCDVVDLGAGTGKLTRALVSLGHRVTAIEPLAEMRAHLTSTGATALDGLAEAIPLPDGVADVVTCAQSFHWFDHARALPEIARVLRPRGRLAIVWNTRDEPEPWVKRLSGLIGAESVGHADADEPLEASGLFGPVERAEFACEQLLDRDTLRDLVLSRSYCAKLPPAEREPILVAVAALYDEVAGGSGLVLPYVTDCFRARAESRSSRPQDDRNDQEPVKRREWSSRARPFLAHTPHVETPEGWEVVDGALQREFRFRDFAGAIDFVNHVAEEAERADHHPDIAIHWNRVTLRWWTHSAQAITERDVEMARRTDAIA